MPPTPISQPEWVPVDGLEPLSTSEAVRLAENLPVDPYCVLEYGYLRHGIDRAFVDGPLEDPEAVIIQHRNVQGEPVYSGKYPEAGWRLLSRLPGWFCVNGSTEDMTRLVPILQREIRLPFRWLGDMFYTLEAPPQPYSHPSVRRLGMEDIPLLQRTTPKIWSGYQTFEELLTEGIMAAAIVEGRIVSVADNSASNSRYSDIGVTTLEPYRRQGLSTAAACLVAREVQSRGRIPVWSTSSENIASQRVANKLGFRPYGRGEYLVFDGLKERGGYRPA